MRIAILGATSEIAKDLILSFEKYDTHDLTLFARHPASVNDWLSHRRSTRTYDVLSFEQFKTSDHYDAIINFVGVGDPAKAAALGVGILDITWQYDSLALEYLEQHPTCKYLFLSSGAAYCSDFLEPANETTKSSIDLNHLKPQDWYGIAKLHAECRHRALPHFSISDIRVFSYFSHTQNMDSRFLMADIIRAIKNNTTFETSNENIFRDYLHSKDFHQIINLILLSNNCNTVVDCYSIKPIDKYYLLDIMKERFNLKYCIINNNSKLISKNKLQYYSVNHLLFSQFNYKPLHSSESCLLEQTHLKLIEN